MRARLPGRLALAPTAALLCSLLLSAPAWAHGGRFQGPGGRGMPGDPNAPSAPAPKRGKPATTPGAGIPTTRGALPDVYWGTWWALNRWEYLPPRGQALRNRLVLTGAQEPPLRELLTHERRALLARQHVKPYLLGLLDPAANEKGGEKGDEKDTVTAAAMLALGKIDNTADTLRLLLKIAEDESKSPLERESAALAVGLMRRTRTELRIDAISLDLARTRLLDLLEDEKNELRARCFSAFALGLLADQGYGSPFSKEGRLVVKGLLQALRQRHESPDLPIAVLTALSMQPRAGIPTGVFDGLREAVTGRRVYKREWTPIERAHALSTYARLEGPGWIALSMRALTDRKLPDPVQRTARLMLGSYAGRLGPDERLDVAKALIASERSAPGSLSRGLGQIALARVFNADLKDGCLTLLEKTDAERILITGATKALLPVRGFHVLALALAARGVETKNPDILEFTDAARKTMLAGFDKPRGDNDLKSAYVVGIGMLKIGEAKDRLVGVLKERNPGPAIRSRCAIALAAIEAADGDVLDALRAVLADSRPLAPRAAAALSLAILTGVPSSDELVKQMREAKSQREQTQAAAALGQLDDPKALPSIIRMARMGGSNFELRALAISILGLLCDPEERPSLFGLTLDANYVARTDALNEAFTLL